MRNYDPQEVSLICGGALIQGFADGEFIRVEPAADDFTEKVSPDGTVSRARTGDRRAMMTIILHQTSPSNDVLTAFAELDRTTPNGGGVFSILLRDRQGTTQIQAEEAYVKRRPNVGFGGEIQNREWTILLAEADYFVGGN